LKICGKTDHIFYLQERLGELPANDDHRSGRNDQHVGNDAQQNGETEAVQGGH